MSHSLASVLDHVKLPASYQISDRDFEVVRKLIYREAGINLSETKRALVCSRLAKRLRELNLRSHGEYLDYLANRDPDGRERQEMINCLTTNKTDFFREPHHFAFLRDTVFPQLERKAARGGSRRLRIWSAGCSMGDEPYTIAMEVLEYPGFRWGWDIRILASDISTRVLQTAEQGVYPMERLAPVRADLRQRYFLKGSAQSEGLCQVRPELKRLIAFRRINFMAATWPVSTHFDVIFCRNVIIYFDAPTQQHLLRRLVEHLNPGGYLILGHSENPHWLTEIASSLGKTVYQRPPQSSAGRSFSCDAEIPRATAHCAASVPSALPKARPAPSKARVAPACRKASVTSLPQDAAALRAQPPLRRTLHEGAARRREIVAGEFHASREPAEISTLLGSCVAACLYDPRARIGGMNHFMLPCQGMDLSVSARYGCHAMELLINDIMKLGGDRRRLKAKVFGGANVLCLSNSLRNVGTMNVEFVRKFLETDGIPIVAERLGGNCPLRVHFLTSTGKAFVKIFVKNEAFHDRERQCAEHAARRPISLPQDNVTLF